MQSINTGTSLNYTPFELPIMSTTHTIIGVLILQVVYLDVMNEILMCNFIPRTLIVVFTCGLAQDNVVEVTQYFPFYWYTSTLEALS